VKVRGLGSKDGVEGIGGGERVRAKTDDRL